MLPLNNATHVTCHCYRHLMTFSVHSHSDAQTCRERIVPNSDLDMDAFDGDGDRTNGSNMELPVPVANRNKNTVPCAE